MPDEHAVVFDDDDLFCILFTRIFKSRNIQVSAYPNPRDYQCSPSQVKTCPVAEPCADFLLTDHTMPEMTGLEFLQMIQRKGCKIQPERKAIISGNWLAEDLAAAARLGVRVFEKSSSKQQILNWVETTP